MAARVRFAVSLLLCAFSASSAEPAHGVDVVLLRDGTRRLGTLQACVGGQCRLDGQTLARATIARIGFSTDETAGPAVGDPSRDEVRLRDGTLHPGHIEGISLGSVLAASGAFDRATVAWVYFASEAAAEPPARDGGGGGGSGTEDEKPEQPEQPPQPPQPPPPPPEGGTPDPPPVNPPPRRPLPPRDPPASPVEPCPPARPLGGYVEVREHRVQPQQFERRSVEQMWFRLRAVNEKAPWPRQLAGRFVASELVWKVRAEACVDLPGGEGFATEVCRCPATSAAGRTALDLGQRVVFTPLAPELDLKVLPEISDADRAPLDCTDQTGGSHSEVGGTGVSSPYWIGPDCEHQLCVRPTGCEPVPGSPCLAHPERHAVIPFEGKARATDVYVGGPLGVDLSWRVCCGCGEPIGKGPEPESDPCADPAAARGLADVAAREAQRRRDELRELWRQFESDWARASDLQDEYREAILKCAAWEAGMKLLEFFAGGPEAPASAQAFFQVFNLATQILEGDPTAALAVTGGMDDIDVGGLWGLVSDVVTGAQDVSRRGSIPAMRSKLEDCSGTPILSDATYDGARAYLDNLEAALRRLPRVYQLMTEIGQWDVEQWQRELAAYEACLEWARCKELDPAVCGPAPAGPH